MGLDQISAIHPAICEVFEAAAGGEEWCAAFELSSDPERWVQVTSDTLNMAYPYEDQPVLLLQRTEVTKATDLALSVWEPYVYATFKYSRHLSTRDLAHLVDQLFVSVLKCTDPDYPVDVEIFPLS
jgi:hypothetical protein